MRNCNDSPLSVIVCVSVGELELLKMQKDFFDFNHIKLEFKHN